MANKDEDFINNKAKEFFKDCPGELKDAALKYISTLSNTLHEKPVSALSSYTASVCLFYGLIPAEIRPAIRRTLISALDMVDNGALPSIEKIREMKEDGTWDKFKENKKKEMNKDGN